MLHAVALAIRAIACNERVGAEVVPGKFAIYRGRLVDDLLRPFGVLVHGLFAVGSSSATRHVCLFPWWYSVHSRH